MQLTQKQILAHNKKIRLQNAAKRATNKAYYYKQEITSLKQLEKNIIRVIDNFNMGISTKQKHVSTMFASYIKNK